MNEEVKQPLSESGGDQHPAQSPGEQPGAPPGAWAEFLAVVKSSRLFHPDEWPVKTILGTALVVAVLIFAIALVQQGGVRMRENEVGVKVNNLTGALTLEERVGYHFFLPYLANFYVLDKTIQKLSLTWDQGPGGRSGRDVKLKTADGNNVSLDVTINYKVIPEEAVKILRGSGQGTRFSDVWAEPFARHACFDAFGRLNTEEIYDAAKRNEMAQGVMAQMNEKLRTQGIEVIAVMPGEFRFYQEYEQVIQAKKLADQQVEEQQAQARASLEDQERQLLEARKRAETRIATFEGDSSNKLMTAEAEAARTRREADGQSRFTRLSADSALYATTQQATGRKESLLAEADGMAQMRKAMAGDGGVDMVGLEYARRLNTIRFIGTPITKQSTVQQFSVQPAEAAAATHGGGR